MTRWDGYGLTVIKGDYSIRLAVKTSWGSDYNRCIGEDSIGNGRRSIWFEEGKVGMRLV